MNRKELTRIGQTLNCGGKGGTPGPCKGEHYDYFGEKRRVIKVSKDGKKIMTARVDSDDFGKEILHSHKEFHPRDFSLMKKVDH